MRQLLMAVWSLSMLFTACITVAKAPGMTEDTVQSFIKKHTEERQFGILGEPRVNVLMLNLDLDGKL